MYSRRCWNIPRARIPLWWKCYFPQIVWFTVNEFSLPIIIWRSFRSPPDHRGLCCRKHERKYLEISACSSLGGACSSLGGRDLDIPRPVNGGNYQLIKETSNYGSHCFFFSGKHLLKSWFQIILILRYIKALFLNDEKMNFQTGEVSVGL